MWCAAGDCSILINALRLYVKITLVAASGPKVLVNLAGASARATPAAIQGMIIGR